MSNANNGFLGFDFHGVRVQVAYDEPETFLSPELAEQFRKCGGVILLSPERYDEAFKSALEANQKR